VLRCLRHDCYATRRHSAPRRGCTSVACHVVLQLRYWRYYDMFYDAERVALPRPARGEKIRLRLISPHAYAMPPLRQFIFFSPRHTNNTCQYNTIMPRLRARHYAHGWHTPSFTSCSVTMANIRIQYVRSRIDTPRCIRMPSPTLADSRHFSILPPRHCHRAFLSLPRQHFTLHVITPLL